VDNDGLASFENEVVWAWINYNTIFSLGFNCYFLNI